MNENARISPIEMRSVSRLGSFTLIVGKVVNTKQYGITFFHHKHEDRL